MKEETLRRLLAADHPTHCLGPLDRDEENYERRFNELNTEITTLLGVSLKLAIGFQDSSLFAALWLDEIGLRILFSNFGDLFTIEDENQIKLLTPNEFDQLVDLVEAHNFVYVDYNELGATYSGENAQYRRERYDRLRNGVVRKEAASWHTRFFDYM